jgi:hypothetical protein
MRIILKDLRWCENRENIAETIGVTPLRFEFLCESIGYPVSGRRKELKMESGQLTKTAL